MTCLLKEVSKLPNRRLVGASVIAITRDPFHNNVYVYLGRERRYPQWQESETWSDFGGGVRYDPSTNIPETAEATASREAWEETAGAMNFHLGDRENKQNSTKNFNTSHAYLQGMLEAHRYVLKLTISQPDGAEYVCFVIETPWEPDLPMRFAKLTRALRAKRDYNLDSPDIPEKHPAIISNRVNPCFIEKTSIALFSVPILERALLDKNAISRRHNRVEYLRGTFAVRLRLVLTHLGSLSFKEVRGPRLNGITWAIGETPDDKDRPRLEGS